MTDLNRARLAMERARRVAKEADTGESVRIEPPSPMSDNKEGLRRWLDDCWTDAHQPVPVGWDEFLAYLAAARAYSAALYRERCEQRET